MFFFFSFFFFFQLVSHNAGRIWSSATVSYEPLTVKSVLRISQASVSEDNGNFECRIISRDMERSLKFEARVSEPHPEEETTAEVNYTQPDEDENRIEHAAREDEETSEAAERYGHHRNETQRSETVSGA
jgi:hypothetical protein